MYRWSWAASALAIAAMAVLVFGTWPWAWPFLIASVFCSYMQARGPLANRKRMRLADMADAVIQQAREQAPVSANSLWALERSAPRRRAFEPLCGCPRCGLLTYHLFGAPFEHTERRPEWKAGPGRLWVEQEIDEVSVWNTEGVYRVRHRETGRMVMKKQVLMCVQRECLSCGHEWTEELS